MAQRKLEVVITGESRGLRQALGQASSDTDSFAGKLKSGLSSSAMAVGAAGVAAVAGVGFVLKGAYDAAIESQKVTNETARVVDSMGASAWTSADAVAGLSTRISNLTGADDELVQSGANLLLTFGNIKNAAGAGNDVFDQAVGLSLDLATAMGTDMNSASIQLGKALNDPIKGITALTRSGVSFTQQQKDQITKMTEAGNILGAQKIILGEVSKQFGGAAAAAATPMDRLKVVVGNLQESLGERLIPVVSTVATWFADKLPAAMDFVGPILDEIGGAASAFFGALVDGGDDITSSGFAGVLEGIGIQVRNIWDAVTSVDWGGVFGTIGDVALPVFNGLRDVIGFVVDNFESFGPAILIAAGALATYQVATTIASAVTAAWNAVLAANPITLIILAIAALVAGIMYAYNNIDWFRAAVDDAWQGIQMVIDFAWNQVIKPVWDAIYNFVETYLIPIIQAYATVYKTAWDVIVTAVQWAWDNVIKPIWDAIYNFIVTYLIPYWQQLWSVAQTVWGGISSVVSAAWSVLSTVFGYITGGVSTVMGFFTSLRDGIANAVSTIADIVWSPFKTAFNWIARGWNDTVGKLSFTIPSWVPVIGGNGFSMPKLPTFHTGGTFLAPTPGGVGLALLRDRERVGVPTGGTDMAGAQPAATNITYLTVKVEGSVITRDEDLADVVAGALNRTQRGRIQPILVAGVSA